MHSCKPQYSPYPASPRKYGEAPQETMPNDKAPPATKDKITHIQKVVRSILYYSQAVDLTVLMDLSTIASEQAKATKTALKNGNQVLDYLTTNPDVTIIFYALDMILNTRLNASYLSDKSTKIRASGHLFLVSVHKYVEPITLNGAILPSEPSLNLWRHQLQNHI